MICDEDDAFLVRVPPSFSPWQILHGLSLPLLPLFLYQRSSRNSLPPPLPLVQWGHDCEAALTRTFQRIRATKQPRDQARGCGGQNGKGEGENGISPGGGKGGILAAGEI